MMIEAGAQAYIAATVPETASLGQRLDTRRTFYAGASHVLDLIREAGSATGLAVTLSSIEAEIQKFAKAAKSGMA